MMAGKGKGKKNPSLKMTLVCNSPFIYLKSEWDPLKTKGFAEIPGVYKYNLIGKTHSCDNAFQ